VQCRVIGAPHVNIDGQRVQRRRRMSSLGVVSGVASGGEYNERVCQTLWQVRQLWGEVSWELERVRS
jgi:hypothetical protein